MNDVILAGALCFGAALVLIALYFRLSSQRAKFEVSVEWWRDFDPARYAPLQRLLDEDDIRYVRSLRGYDSRIEKDLRRRRAEIFRSYLTDLVEDFERLQMVGKLMVMAGGATPMLREQLFLQKLAFSKALFRVRVQLALNSLGLGRVDARSLIEALQSTNVVMHSALPGASAA